MRLIRKLKYNDLDKFARIVGNAYPEYKIFSKDDIEKFKNNYLFKIENENHNVSFYGVFEDDELIGGMRFQDFNMNLLNNKVKAGGLGLVAVDLIHKKEKVAMEIVKNFIYHYKNLGAVMTLLYPFRPDFYKNMGFGFGANMNQFKVKPCNLPKGNSKKHIKILDISYCNKICDCYNKIANKTNGLIEKYDLDFLSVFNNSSNKIIGYVIDDEIKGYVIFQFKGGLKDNFTINDMIISEFIYESPEIFSEFITFFNSQQDQIRHIIFNTQDENFRFMLNDPRDESFNIFAQSYHQSNIQGTGVMYRVIDVEKLLYNLKNNNFGNKSCKLKLNIKDNFIKENNKAYTIHFKDGYLNLIFSNMYEVEVTMDICDFSSLITCAVDLKSLYRYGKVEISNIEYLSLLNDIFESDEKPMCMNLF